MEKLGEEWVEELRLQTEEHMQYFPLRTSLELLSPDFNAVVAALEPEQRRIILEYFRVQQKMEVFLTRQAYLTGIQVGERRADKK